jgi:hypothetical protein
VPASRPIDHQRGPTRIINAGRPMGRPIRRVHHRRHGGRMQYAPTRD